MQNKVPGMLPDVRDTDQVVAAGAAVTKVANSLPDIYETLSQEPLRTPEELQAYYRDELNAVRGGNVVGRLTLWLNRAWNALPCKAFLMGHPGVGKSTELTRLIQEIDGRFSAIRFSAAADLDPACFQPFDVLLLMMAEVVERTSRPVGDGGAGTTGEQRSGTADSRYPGLRSAASTP